MSLAQTMGSKHHHTCSPAQSHVGVHCVVYWDRALLGWQEDQGGACRVGEPWLSSLVQSFGCSHSGDHSLSSSHLWRLKRAIPISEDPVPGPVMLKLRVLGPKPVWEHEGSIKSPPMLPSTHTCYMQLSRIADMALHLRT